MHDPPVRTFVLISCALGSHESIDDLVERAGHVPLPPRTTSRSRLGENDFGAPQVFAPWKCDGHAPHALPTQVQGIMVGVDNGWTHHLDQLIDADGHVDALIAFRETLAGTAAVETFDRTMAVWILAGTPRQRRVGLCVAWSRGAPLLVDAIEAVVNEGATGFRGQPDDQPLEGGDLETRLWITYADLAVAGRIPGDRALPELHQAVERGFGPWLYRNLPRRIRS